MSGMSGMRLVSSAALCCVAMRICPSCGAMEEKEKEEEDTQRVGPHVCKI
jgi:hypothetical protein